MIVQCQSALVRFPDKQSSPEFMKCKERVLNNWSARAFVGTQCNVWTVNMVELKVRKWFSQQMMCWIHPEFMTGVQAKLSEQLVCSEPEQLLLF